MKESPQLKTHTQRHTETDTKTDRQTETDTKTDRQTDRQTETDTKTDRQTDRDREIAYTHTRNKNKISHDYRTDICNGGIPQP